MKPPKSPITYIRHRTIWEYVLSDGTALRSDVVPAVLPESREYIVRIRQNGISINTGVSYDKWLPLFRVNNELHVLTDFSEFVSRKDITPTDLIGLIEAISVFETIDDVMSS